MHLEVVLFVSAKRTEAGDTTLSKPSLGVLRLVCGLESEREYYGD